MCTRNIKKNLTKNNGQPIGNDDNVITAGVNGPLLLEDTQFIQKIQCLTRERIPERVVHARGTGAHGIFTSTKDISHLTSMNLFTGNNLETKVFTRFSKVTNSKGSPEYLRDLHGFATKFYTKEGNWDLVSMNLPAYLLRDPLNSPDVVHAIKPSPTTNWQDPNRYLDYFSFIPESIQALTYFYSKYGIPASYRKMEGNSINAYKFVNKDKKVTYVKFYWKSCQGIQNLTSKQASTKDWNMLTKDLYNSIEQEKYPKWELQIQLLKPKDFKKLEFDPLDATKQWLDIPFETIGTLVLNKNPDNVFEETEQVAFKVSNFIPGIEASEDRILQARMFHMPDAQTYRLGINHEKLSINKPIKCIFNYNQEGSMNTDNTKSDINYSPSHSETAYITNKKYEITRTPIHGTTIQKTIKPQMNFYQAGIVYRSFSEKEQHELISNFSGDLNAVTNNDIQVSMISYAYMADKEYGTRLAEKVNIDISIIKEASKKYKEEHDR